MYKRQEQTQANTSIIFVPARFAADAIMEAADAGIQLIAVSYTHLDVYTRKEKDIFLLR